MFRLALPLLLVAQATSATDTMTLKDLFKKVSINEVVPTKLLRAICWVESSHNPRAMNHHDGGSASYGLCQIKLATARLLGFQGTPNRLREPQTNIKYAAKYLHKQLVRYKQDWVKATIAYNRGVYKLDRRGNHYLRKVLNAMREKR